MPLLYRWLLKLLRRFGHLGVRRDSKLHRGLVGRQSAHEVLSAWGREKRDPSRPVAWFHAPSVGEGLQALAVIDALRELRADLQVVFTYFSPSAEALSRRMAPDVAAYLPWDLTETVAESLDAVRPDLLVFTKTEVWPVLVAEASERSIPLAIVGASVPEGSSRARWPTRSLLRPTWARLSVACANTDEDAARLAELGVRSSVVHTTGDPGIDSAAQRAAAADAEAPYLAPFRATPRPRLVAGSTWPSGEAVLIPALAGVKVDVPDLQVVLAPHEPSESRVGALMDRFRRDGWRTATLSEIEERGTASESDVVVVDRVGVLAHLYTVGDVAYVGGGFHTLGLHSVLEPAAAGIPVVFGPGHDNARAAGDLLMAGGAKIAANVDEMSRSLSGWFTDAVAREGAGRKAFGYIDAHRGAAARAAELLQALMMKDVA